MSWIRQDQFRCRTTLDDVQMHIDHCVPGIFCGLTLSRFISVLVSISSIKFKKIVSTLFFLEVHTLYRNPENRNLFVTKNHHRLTSETMFKWRFAGGPIMAIEMAFRWWPKFACWLGSFVIFQRIRTITYMEPYIFVIVQGVGVRTPVPFYGSAHELYIYITKSINTECFSDILLLSYISTMVVG